MRVGAGTTGQRRTGQKRRGLPPGLLLGGAVVVLALPSAVLAFSSTLQMMPSNDAEIGGIATPSSKSGLAGKSELGAGIPVRSLARGHAFRFTPAGIPTRPDRSVTVAVRVDAQSARSIVVRGERLVLPGSRSSSASTPLQIAPTAFSLGVSRGYQSFAQALTTPAEVSRIDMPDLSKLSAARQSSESARFAPRISIDDSLPTGRAPRTFGGAGQDKVDVGGALRVTRNLDVTAGVRYTPDRERLRPLNDGKQDSQAVYVGTQFRF